MGGKNWPPTAYNPDLKLWYIPVIESCNRITVDAGEDPAEAKPREFCTGGGPIAAVPHHRQRDRDRRDDRQGCRQVRDAVPDAGRHCWRPRIWCSTGQPSGEVCALDAKTLQKLWSFNTGGGVSAPPMTFTVDGKQYIAILVGQGGAWDKWFIELDARAEADAAGLDALRLRALRPEPARPVAARPRRFMILEIEFRDN